jgi:adenylate cyclase
MSDQSSFFPELKRRNTYKVAVADAAAGWLLVQVATQVFPFPAIPNQGVREFAQPMSPAK